MAKRLGLLILLISLASLLSLALSSSSPSPPEGLDWWCNKTRYPETCKYTWRQHRSRNPRSFDPNHRRRRSEFKRLELEITLEQAVSAEGHNQRLGSRCRNARERAAWRDCLRLYEDGVFLLNKTLLGGPSKPNPTSADTLTWLSAALTNLETCRAGFAELGVTDYVLPLMSNNVSRLVSNALSVSSAGNGSDGAAPPPAGSDFPRWVSGRDRRLLQAAGSVAADLVVAQDGTGNHRTIQAALDAAEAVRNGTSRRFVIRIRRGVYNENLDIGKKLKNIMLLGDGMRFTFITGNRSVGGGSTTFNSATVAVTAEGFIAQGITFRNTAGPQNHQAVALRSGADLSVFFRCGFEGYQDTLYVHSNRQFYKECYIYGTVDFIFGNAAVVLQNCMIYARRPMPNQRIAVTAQGRIDPNQNTGISIHNSRVMASDDLRPVQASFRTYLGRPWKQFSRTIFSQTYLEGLVDPAGWLEWDGNFALDTLFYAEYRNTGPGSPTGSRVKWLGYRVLTNASQVSPFMVANFIDGNSWLPATGVPFTAGL